MASATTSKKNPMSKKNPLGAPPRCAVSRGDGGGVQRSCGLGVGGGSHGAVGRGITPSDGAGTDPRVSCFPCVGRESHRGAQGGGVTADEWEAEAMPPPHKIKRTAKFKRTAKLKQTGGDLLQRWRELRGRPISYGQAGVPTPRVWATRKTLYQLYRVEGQIQ